MMTRPLPALYLITDRTQVPAGRHLLGVLEELLEAGVRMIQLREKDLAAAELYPLAKELRTLTYRYDSLLLINDRIDLAQAVAADGVHLGGHSLPVEVVRQILGSDALIGVSTHSLSELEAAVGQGADFVTCGPVFFTPSKAAFGEPVGVESLQEMCRCSRVPVYALGGINPANVEAVVATEVYGIAVISSLLAAPSPRQEYFQLTGGLLNRSAI